MLKYLLLITCLLLVVIPPVEAQGLSRCAKIKKMYEEDDYSKNHLTKYIQEILHFADTKIKPLRKVSENTIMFTNSSGFYLVPACYGNTPDTPYTRGGFYPIGMFFIPRNEVEDNHARYFLGVTEHGLEVLIPQSHLEVFPKGAIYAFAKAFPVSIFRMTDPTKEKFEKKKTQVLKATKRYAQILDVAPRDISLIEKRAYCSKLKNHSNQYFKINIYDELHELLNERNRYIKICDDRSGCPEENSSLHIETYATAKNKFDRMEFRGRVLRIDHDISEIIKKIANSKLLKSCDDPPIKQGLESFPTPIREGYAKSDSWMNAISYFDISKSDYIDWNKYRPVESWMIKKNDHNRVAKNFMSLDSPHMIIGRYSCDSTNRKPILFAIGHPQLAKDKDASQFITFKYETAIELYKATTKEKHEEITIKNRPDITWTVNNAASYYNWKSTLDFIVRKSNQLPLHGSVITKEDSMALQCQDLITHILLATIYNYPAAN